MLLYLDVKWDNDKQQTPNLYFFGLYIKWFLVTIFLLECNICLEMDQETSLQEKYEEMIQYINNIYLQLHYNIPLDPMQVEYTTIFSHKKKSEMVLITLENFKWVLHSKLKRIRWAYSKNITLGNPKSTEIIKFIPQSSSYKV